MAAMRAAIAGAWSPYDPAVEFLLFRRCLRAA
jgi:hypothetical protein